MAPALARYARFVTLEHYSPAEIFMLGYVGGDGPVRPDRFVSKQRTLEAHLRLNPREYFPRTEDKLEFARFCATHGLATPEVLLALDPAATRDTPFPTARDTAQFMARLASAPPGEVVLKPVEGVHGQGVQVLRLEHGRLHALDGAERAIESLTAPFPDYRRWLLQVRAHPHRLLRQLSGSPYLQTARVVTALDREGVATVPIAWLRIIARGNVFDNFNFGASGNLVATLDLDQGTLDHVLAPGGAHRGIVEATRHPDTGAEFAGFRLPHAAGVRDLVLRAARAFAPLRTIGWDVAVTDSGPLLIEGNVTWDPLPTRRDLRSIVAELG